MKEFSEFPSIGKDYDITSSLKEGSNSKKSSYANPYTSQLVDLVGFLEDGEWLAYGISDEEYLNPNEKTIIKVKKYLETHKQDPLINKGMNK